MGIDPVAAVNPLKAAAVLACVTAKSATLEGPPPGAGFHTLTVAVKAPLIIAELTWPVTSSALTKVVVSGEPLKRIMAPETKPDPLTVSVKDDEPGATLAGTSGAVMKGTGLELEAGDAADVNSRTVSGHATKLPNLFDLHMAIPLKN